MNEVNLVNLAHTIYINKKVSVLTAIDEAAKWFKRIYDADTNTVSKIELNDFLKRVDKKNTWKGENDNECNRRTDI